MTLSLLLTLFVASSLFAGPAAFADDKSTAAFDEGPVLAEEPADTVVYKSRNSKTKTFDRPINAKRDMCRKRVCAQDKRSKSKDGYRVFVETQLSVDDRGVIEYVAGRVYGHTGAPSSRVLSMMVGGALYRHTNCPRALEDGQMLAAGNETVRKKHYVYWGWTAWYRGFNDCWWQAGHNYWEIRLPGGEKWKDNVPSDEVREF